MSRHPCMLDHSPDNLLRLANACREASQDMMFDDLQDAANALTDWASIIEGETLTDLDGNTYPLPLRTKENPSD